MVKSGTDIDDVRIGSSSDRKSKDMLGMPDACAHELHTQAYVLAAN